MRRAALFLASLALSAALPGLARATYVEKLTVSVTTAADGTATAYSTPVTGCVASLHYVKTDFADGVDFTITREDLGESLWTETNVNASAVRRPRLATHDGAGAASLFAAAGEPVEDIVCLAAERVKIAIAQGGSVKSGTFYLIVR